MSKYLKSLSEEEIREEYASATRFAECTDYWDFVVKVEDEIKRRGLDPSF